MASVKLRTSDALIRQLSQISGEGADEAAKRAIYVGAGYMAERIKESLRGVVSENATGDLEDSLGITTIKLNKRGDWSARIGFHGYDRKGVSNILKARVLESGSSKQRKRPFFSPAVKKYRKIAEERMKNEAEMTIEKYLEG